VNVGGISNITLLPADLSLPVRGFDTGPGNTLLDLWVNLHLGLAFDREGHWSSQGTVDKLLLEKFLADAYFQLPPPKSTGREYFNLEWLKAKIERQQISPQDVQATLVELTARCINDAISELMPGEKEVLVCGGGAFNKSLMDSLMTKLQPNNVCSTEKLGVDPRFVEAIAFAWLARQTFNKLPGNLPAVTGANREVILGGIYFP
jgi:anhydro-N-acetylmuramic acid kinase